MSRPKRNEKISSQNSFPPYNKDELVDISDVHVDPNLPPEERLAEFVRQIKNPYLYKCGNFVIHAKYDPDGPTLEQCVRQALGLGEGAL